MTYYYDFMIRRTRYKQAIPEARTQAEAEAVEIQKKREVYEGRYGTDKHSTPMLADFVEGVYLPWARENKRSSYDDELISRVIGEFFIGKRLGEITPKLVRRFQQERVNTPARKGKDEKGNEITAHRQPATVNREVSVLSRMFSLAVEEEAIEDNPCLKVKALKLDNQVISYLNRDEEGKLLTYCEGVRAHLRPILLVDINTGLRRGELFSLRKYQLDFNLGCIIVGKRVRQQTASKTKTGKGRIVPMNSVVREELLKLTEGKGDLEYVFINTETGKPFRDVKTAFKKACGLAGIDGLRFHDLRHTFGTRLAEAGESLHRIAELMGHGNIQMTMRYAHALVAGKHAAVERLVSYQEIDCPKIVPNEKQPTERLAVNS
jgi:integrase